MPGSVSNSFRELYAPRGGIGDHGIPQRVLALALYPRDRGEDLIRAPAEGDLCDLGRPFRHGARLVKDGEFDVMQRFESFAALEEHPVLRALARTHHDGDGSGEPQRAGAGDDKDGDCAGQRVLEGIASREPAYEGDERDAHHHGHEDAGDLVRDLGDGGFIGARVFNEFDDLAQHALAAHGGDARGDVPRPVHGAADELCALRLFHGDALAAYRALIHKGVPVRDDGVRGHGHPRLDDDDVARRESLAVHFPLLAVAEHYGTLGHQPAQPVESVARAALGERLEIFPHRHEREDHARGLKIEVVQIALDERGIPRAQPVTHAEYREYTVSERRRRPNSDEGIHVGRKGEQPLETVDVVRAVDIDDGQAQQDLQKRIGHRVLRPREEGRQRRSEHVPHADIHQHHHEDEGDDETHPHLFGRLRTHVSPLLRSLIFARGHTAPLLGRGAVTRLHDGGNDVLRREQALVILRRHRVGEQIDGRAPHARELAHRVLHMGGTRRTGHARNNKSRLCHKLL